VAANHPLGDKGELLFLADDTPIYAADVIDDAGKPVLPRQAPFQKTIQIYLTNGNAADEGAYVDLQADPPIAFKFVSVDDTCVHLAGAFRCTAAEDGFATFAVRSDSDYSDSPNGGANVRVVGRREFEQVVVLPAGLPATATNFSMVIEGVGGNSVQARYDDLECTLEPSPDDTFNKWQRPRVREARITATAPINAPTVIEHAPVIIQTLHPEVVVSLDPSCPEPRASHLRVQLDATGNSPPFYFCFSDIGGTDARIAFNSGGQITVTPRTLDIDPEPRLLRLVTTLTDLSTADGSASPVSVSAFDADLQKVELAVDMRSTDTSVLRLTNATATLPAEGGGVLAVQTTIEGPGTAQIEITPELHSQPVCSSLPITVTAP
jgi:hypothetical protein